MSLPTPQAPPPSALQPLSILVASDVRLYSEGLRHCLTQSGRFHVVGVADHPSTVISSAEALQPLVVLLDQTMSDGLDQVRRLQRVSSHPKVIALGMPDQEEMLLEWAEAGVSGFVPRDASVEDLVSTVESAVRGEFHCTAKLAGTLLRRLACRPSAASIWGAGERLTPRESEIVGLIDGGLSNKEIAVRLGIEVATVKNHVHNLLEKLRVRRRGEAAARLRSHEH